MKAVFPCATMLIALGLGLTTLQLSQAKEFTSTDGKKLNGEVVNVRGDQVVIKSGTKTFTVPQNRFIDSDRQYFAEWVVEDAKNRIPKLEVSFSSGKGGNFDRADKGLGDDRVGKFEFKINVKNLEQGYDLKKASAKFVVIGEDVERKDRYIIMQSETFNFSVAFGDTFTWQGKMVSYRYDESEPSLWGHKHYGYALEIKNETGKVIYLKAMPAKFEKQASDLVNIGLSYGFGKDVTKPERTGNYID